MKTKRLGITFAISLFVGSSFSTHANSTHANFLQIPLDSVQSYLDKQATATPQHLKQRVDHIDARVSTNDADIFRLQKKLGDVHQSTKNLAITQANNKKHIENQLKNSNKMSELKLEDVANRSQSYTNLSVDNLRLQSFEKMDKLSDQVYGEIININDQLDEKIVQLDNRYEQQVTQLKHKINKTAKQANSGIASVAAMSNIPYSLNSRFSAGLGIGHYKNGKALAAGAQYQVRKNVNLRSSIAWNNANSPVIGAGVAVGW